MGGKGYHLLTYVAAEIIVNHIEIIMLNLILLLLTCVSKNFLATKIGPQGNKFEYSNKIDENMYSNSNFVNFWATEMFDIKIG